MLSIVCRLFRHRRRLSIESSHHDSRLLLDLDRDLLQSPLRHPLRPHPRSILDIASLLPLDVNTILSSALAFKRTADLDRDLLRRQTVALLVDSPSLRFRMSFESAAAQLGASTTTYYVRDLPTDMHSVTLSEAAVVLSTYADCLVVGIDDPRNLKDVADFSQVPVINAEDAQGNPFDRTRLGHLPPGIVPDRRSLCIVLSDFVSIAEHRHNLTGLRVAFLGDLNSSRTYEIMRASCLLGMTTKAYDIHHADTSHLLQPKSVADEVGGGAFVPGGVRELNPNGHLMAGVPISSWI